MEDQYVLFYSYGCKKSQELSILLEKNPLQHSIKMFCIDGLPLLPKYIRYTPTLKINHHRYGTQYLIGDQVIEWLNMFKQEAKPLKEKEDISLELENVDSIDTAFRHENDLNPDNNECIDDMFKISSGNFNGDPQRHGMSEGKLDSMDIESRMRQLQEERDQLDKSIQRL